MATPSKPLYEHLKWTNISHPEIEDLYAQLAAVADLAMATWNPLSKYTQLIDSVNLQILV